MQTMATTKLSERITTCSLAIRFLRGNVDHKASYDDVMESLLHDKMTKKLNADLTRASVEYLRAGFVGRETRDRKVHVALCVAISIADDRAQRGLAKEICDRFQRVEDFDIRVMNNVFKLSVLNDRVLVLLDNAMVFKKKNVDKDIQHEFCVEFVLSFFGIVESALRRGKHLGELGYVATATPSDLKDARAILEKHVSSIAERCGPCFKPSGLKKPRPKNKFFPAKDAPPQVQIGCEHVNYDEATVNTLQECLFDTKERGVFLDIIFAIVSHAHKKPADTFAGMKLDTTKGFFLETVLDKTDADNVLKDISKTPQEQRLCEKMDSLEEALVEANRETKRTTAVVDSQKKELVEAASEIKSLMRRRDDLEFRLEMADSKTVNTKKFLEEQVIDATEETARVTAFCADQKKQLHEAIREKRRFRQMRDETKVENMRLQEVCDARKKQLDEASIEKRSPQDLHDEKKDRGDDVSDKKRQKICPFQLEMVMSGVV